MVLTNDLRNPTACVVDYQARTSITPERFGHNVSAEVNGTLNTFSCARAQLQVLTC